jgi:hypothetical protein
VLSLLGRRGVPLGDVPITPEREKIVRKCAALVRKAKSTTSEGEKAAAVHQLERVSQRHSVTKGELRYVQRLIEWEEKSRVDQALL